MTTFLRDYAARLSRVRGHGLAYAEGPHTRTWREIDERSGRLASAFDSIGLRPGDRAAIIAEDRIEMVDHWHACFRSGIVRVGINWRYSAREMDHIVQDADIGLILIQSRFVKAVGDYIGAWRAQGRVVVGFGDDHGMESDLENLIAEADVASEPARVELTDTSPIAISYTSGSTGMPKGAVLTQLGAATQIGSSPYAAGFGPDDVILNNLPGSGFPIFIHTFGMSIGAATVLPGRFDVDRTIETIEHRGVTVMFCVPTMLHAIEQRCRELRHDLPTLRLVVMLGSPVVPAIVERAHSIFDCAFQNWYGSTEATGAIVMERNLLRHLGTGGPATVGRPLLHVDVEIHDDDDNQVGPGVHGEICVRGPILSHYHGMPQETEIAFRNGWFHMGDIGYADEDGRIHLTDRRKFMIISGGYNVYPAVVENVLADHPGVAEVAVVGAPHPHWGEVVVATVVRAGAHYSTADELIEFCRPRLGKWEVPKHVDFVDALPVGTTGKIQKLEITKRFRDNPELFDWNREAAL